MMAFETKEPRSGDWNAPRWGSARSGVTRGMFGVIVSCVALLLPFRVPAQTAQEGKNLGALAPQNLHKPRPKAPADLTGTYNFDVAGEGGPLLAVNFSPTPQLTPAAQAAVDKRAEFAKRGLEYRDDSAACWPLGVPRIMTRYWPIQIVQLPTEVLLISMFDNNVRWIYTDGRPHPDDNDLIYTYNGHSIGHWEGKTLVVDTVGLTDDHHWIQAGVPSGAKLHVIERLSKTKQGIQIEFNMTDPDNWVGEWKSTKHYLEDDHADIEEHICIYEQVSKLPSFKYDVRE